MEYEDDFLDGELNLSDGEDSLPIRKGRQGIAVSDKVDDFFDKELDLEDVKIVVNSNFVLLLETKERTV